MFLVQPDNPDNRDAYGVVLNHSLYIGCLRIVTCASAQQGDESTMERIADTTIIASGWNTGNIVIEQDEDAVLVRAGDIEKFVAAVRRCGTQSSELRAKQRFDDACVRWESMKSELASALVKMEEASDALTACRNTRR